MAKDFIMEGLSFRLSPFEKSILMEHSIELKPRPSYTKHPKQEEK